MDIVPEISVVNEITLVTLQKCPSDISFTADPMAHTHLFHLLFQTMILIKFTYLLPN